METGNLGFALMFLVCSTLLFLPTLRDQYRRLKQLEKE